LRSAINRSAECRAVEPPRPCLRSRGGHRRWPRSPSSTRSSPAGSP
jgi:hypothetical protein